jgi:hypothetical protein
MLRGLRCREEDGPNVSVSLWTVCPLGIDAVVYQMTIAVEASAHGPRGVVGVPEKLASLVHV